MNCILWGLHVLFAICKPVYEAEISLYLVMYTNRCHDRHSFCTVLVRIKGSNFKLSGFHLVIFSVLV
jgi:hypothetical protein